MASKHHRKREGPLQPLLSSSPPSHSYGAEPGPGPSHAAAAAAAAAAAGNSGGAQRRGVVGGRRSTTSPGPDARQARASLPARAGLGSRQLMLTGQHQLQTARQKDKWVPLPEGEDDDASALPAPPEALAAEQLVGTSPDGPGLVPGDEFTALTITPGLFQDLGPGGRVSRQRGRITLYCPADSFDRKKLDEVLRASFPASAIKSYPDVFYVEYFAAADDAPGGDLFFFDYGIVACWGLDGAQEAAVIRTLASKAADSPVDAAEMEVDQFEFNYSSLEKPHIQNDTVTLHRKAARDHQVKLAITYALAQSTKLSLHERRVSDMVLETKHLPESLAASGKVELSPETIAKLIGKVFIQKAAVNLLSSVLDTPEFFWRAPDSFQALYERICEYLELEERVEVLNARFAVLQEMLDMLRDHENNHHNARLEWIVIWLIVVEVVVGLLEVLGLFGLVGSH